MILYSILPYYIIPSNTRIFYSISYSNFLESTVEPSTPQL